MIKTPKSFGEAIGRVPVLIRSGAATPRIIYRPGQEKEAMELLDKTGLVSPGVLLDALRNQKRRANDQRQ